MGRAGMHQPVAAPFQIYKGLSQLLAVVNDFFRLLDAPNLVKFRTDRNEPSRIRCNLSDQPVINMRSIVHVFVAEGIRIPRDTRSSRNPGKLPLRPGGYSLHFFGAFAAEGGASVDAVRQILNILVFRRKLFADGTVHLGERMDLGGEDYTLFALRLKIFRCFMQMIPVAEPPPSTVSGISGQLSEPVFGFEIGAEEVPSWATA